MASGVDNYYAVKDVRWLAVVVLCEGEVLALLMLLAH